MKDEKFVYENPALEEAHFGQFVAGESAGEGGGYGDEDAE